jgi:hypothetical protein
MMERWNNGFWGIDEVVYWEKQIVKAWEKYKISV